MKPMFRPGKPHRQHKPRRLRRHISIWLGVLALVMIAGYSVLVEVSVFKGIEETVAFNLRLAAADYERAWKEDPASPLPTYPRLKAYLGEGSLPVWFRGRFAPLKPGKLMFEEVQLAGPGNCLVLALAHDLPDKRRLYLIETYTDEDDLPGAFRYSDNLAALILTTGIGFILLFFFVARLLFRRVSTSLETLTDWASNLDRQRLEQPGPDFVFTEVEQLADLIRGAVGDLEEALSREHFFLRSASHELRTPIAVLRSNLDLLERLRPDPDGRERTVYQRMNRAVNTMRRLTETLLWLSRKEEKIPMPEPVDILGLVDELVRENYYLLEGKAVEVTVETVKTFTSVPAAACRMALSNLIRNAFQYTASGCVEIRVTAEAIIITNTGQVADASVPDDADFGFGLGLTLVARIARKLNLTYEHCPVPDGHRAVLGLVPAEPEA